MKHSPSSSSNSFQLNSTPMIVSAALIGASAIVGFTGMIVGTSAMVSATRQWLRDLDMPAGEVVKQKLGHAKAATVAGASAWQHHQNSVQRTHA